jgi:hypothetical protein
VTESVGVATLSVMDRRVDAARLTASVGSEIDSDTVLLAAMTLVSKSVGAATDSATVRALATVLATASVGIEMVSATVLA